MMLPASHHRGRPSAFVEPAITLALLLITALVLLQSLPVARDVLSNLSLVMEAGFACLGQPTWIC